MTRRACCRSHAPPRSPQGHFMEDSVHLLRGTTGLLGPADSNLDLEHCAQPPLSWQLGTGLSSSKTLWSRTPRPRVPSLKVPVHTWDLWEVQDALHL